MLSTLFTIALFSSSQESWKQVRFDQTGLRLNLPAEARVNKQGGKLELTSEYKSVQITITASQKTLETAQPVNAAYTEKYKQFHDKYGKKIKSILNEADVYEAALFGAEESIGFVLEVNDGPGRVHAWQRVLIDGWEYDISLNLDRRDQAVMEKILASVQYVDPSSGDFRIAALGATGLQSYLGVAFLPQENVAKEEATSVVLNCDQFPATILATLWQNEEVDYENAAQLKTAMGKWLSGFVQGAQSELTLTPTKGEGQTLYDISGTVTVQGLEIVLIGKAFARRDDAQAMIAVVETRQEGGIDFAKKILGTLTQIPKSD